MHPDWPGETLYTSKWRSECSHSQVIKIESCDRYMFGTCESYWACTKKVIAMAMTFDGQRSSCRSDVEKTGQCAKEEVSSSLLGKLAPPFLCYKHIPS